MQDNHNDCVVPDRLNKRINQLAPIARVKCCDEKAGVSFLTSVLAETELGPIAQQCIPAEPSLQIPTKPFIHTGTYHVQAESETIEVAGVFRESLWI